MKSWTPRERVERALRGDAVAPVPFTMYEGMVFPCKAEREMRNRGMCVVDRRVPICRVHRPNVKVTEAVYWERGRRFVRTALDTPVGTVSTLREDAGFTQWYHERMFRSPDDFRTLLFLIEDELYEASYTAAVEAQKGWGGDGILRTSFGLEPLQQLISSNFMQPDDYCIQWMDNRDEILRLYRAIIEKRRILYPIVAESPISHANYGGNVVPAIIGPEVFREYYLPHYNEAADIMHRNGKLIGCHFDDNNRIIAADIANTDLDYIEAFTPAPVTDMSLGDAREAWPDKVLWLNFPSSVHRDPDEVVRRTTVDLLDEVDSPEGIIMGITEDIPKNRWRDSCRAIMDGLDLHCEQHPDRYPGAEG